MSEPKFFRCDPGARLFPIEWRDIWFRQHTTRNHNGTPIYTCPDCNRGFSHSEIKHLQGDHIWPYSFFGATTWANYQLLCSQCNARKSNYLDTEIRRILGTEEFLKIIVSYLLSKTDPAVRGKLLVRLTESK